MSLLPTYIKTHHVATTMTKEENRVVEHVNLNCVLFEVRRLTYRQYNISLDTICKLSCGVILVTV